MSGRLTGQPVSAVLFDYGNTLMTVERPERALRETYVLIEARLRAEGFLPPEAGVLIREVHDRVDAEFVVHQRSGALEEIDLVAAAAGAYAQLGLQLDAETLDDLLRLEQEAWWVGVHVDPDAVATLEALRAAGVRVGLCSNAPFRVRSMRDQLAHVGLLSHLDAVTFSAEVGWRKPAPQMFEAAMRAVGSRATETVMVGDSVRDDIAGAHGAGLRAILYSADRAHDPEDGAGADARLNLLSELPGLLGVAGRRTQETRHS